MKIITIFVAAGFVFAAAAQSSATDKPADNTKKKTDTKKAARTPDPPAIPADATPVGDGSFRYVDKDGKKWIYRTTPFGVSKAEERPLPPAPKIEDDPAKSEDLGESVRFTRPTPFGPKVWTKKKADLDSYEKSLWERDQNPHKTDTTQRDNPKPGDAAKQD